MKPQRVAVIFGGASGIGLAVARLCANKVGMRLAIADIDENALAQVQKEFPSAICQRCNASDEREVKDFADQVYAKWNDCGFLFNNTGIVRGDSAYKSKLEDWRKVMSVTFEAEVIGTHEFLPRMLKQEFKEAVVVNTSSVAGLANSGLETGAPYTVAKFASRVFSECLAFELRSNPNISVHVLCPGPVNTRLMQNSKKDGEAFEFEKVPFGLSEELLSTKGLSPEYVAEKLSEGILNKKFYIVVTNKNFPVSLIAEMLRMVADDVERGSTIALSYVKPIGDRKKEIGNRFMQAIQNKASHL